MSSYHGRTIKAAREGSHMLRAGALAYPESEHPHAMAGGPKTRGDCFSVPRPCPYVSCKHNLYLDVNENNGSIRLNFPSLEPWQMPPKASCSLDVAAEGALRQEKVATLLGITRERVRQVEQIALYGIASANNRTTSKYMREHAGDGRDVTKAKIRLPILQASGEE